MNLVCLLGLVPCIVSCFLVAGDAVWMPALISANGVLYHGFAHKPTLRVRRCWDVLCNTCLVLYVNYWCSLRLATQMLTFVSVTAFMCNKHSNTIHVGLVQWPLTVAMLLYIA